MQQNVHTCIPYVSLFMLKFTQLGNAKDFNKIINTRLHLQLTLSARPMYNL